MSALDNNGVAGEIVDGVGVLLQDLSVFSAGCGEAEDIGKEREVAEDVNLVQLGCSWWIFQSRGKNGCSSGLYTSRYISLDAGVRFQRAECTFG